MKTKTSILSAIVFSLVVSLVLSCTPAATTTPTSPAPTTPAATTPSATAAPTIPSTAQPSVTSTPTVKPSVIPVKKITISLATAYVENHGTSLVAKDFAAELLKRTQGYDIEFKWYWAGSLGSNMEMLDLVKGGMVAMSGMAHGYYPSTFPLLMMTQLPYVTPNVDTRQLATVRLIEENPKLTEELTRQNIKMICPIVTEVNVMGLKKPAYKIEDLKGLKIRAGGNFSYCVQAWGGVPVTLNAEDCYEALQRGTVDGYLNFAFDAASLYRLPEVAKYTIDTGTGTYSMVEVVMNIDFFEGLPEPVKKAVEEAADAATRNSVSIREANTRKNMPGYLTSTAEFIIWSDAEKARAAEIGGKAAVEAWLSGAEKVVSRTEAQSTWDQLLSFVKELEPSSNYTDGFEMYLKEFKK